MAQRLRTDWILFLTILVMVFFGLIMVYSSSSIAAEVKYHVSSTHFLVRQAGWAVFSFILLLYLNKRDYRNWNDSRYAFAGIGIVLLMLLVVYMTDGKTHRWLRMGPLSLQPSEFAKPALCLFLAYYLSRRLGSINEKHTLLPIALSISAIAFFVAVADLGTAVVLVATTIVVIFVAGLDPRYLVACLGIALLLGVVFIAMKPYRLMRVLTFVDPQHKLLEKYDKGGGIAKYARNTASTSDPAYQQKQAKIAVGSGGFTGVGLMQSRQKMLYLPEAHTDFIYAVVGEETGFVGSSLLLGGFLVVLWRGMRAYWHAGDEFGRYLALAVTVSVVVQALINISVVLDLGPTKGIPLPFISSGGSSLLSSLVLMGMLLSVSEHAS